MSLGRGVSPRTLAWLILIVAMAAAAALAVLWMNSDDSEGAEDGITFVDFASDSTATVGFAGEFPAESLLARPLGLAASTGVIYVADGDGQSVSSFSFRGAFEASAAVEPSSSAPLAYPVDIAVLQDGRLAVIDSTVGRVVVMPPPGEDGESADLVADGEIRPEQPTAIDAAAGAVYVADGATHTVKVYDEDGTFMREIGGDLDPRLTFVGSLHLGEAGLYASDSNAGRVILVDPTSGELLATLQRRMGLPRGMTTDGQGRVYVADGFDAAIYVFDPTGRTVVDVIGDRRTERVEEGGALSTPEALLWDADTNRLYVTDATQGVVKVYNVRPEVPAE